MRQVKENRSESASDCLHSITDAAERLRISQFTVRRLVADGALKAVRIGRRVMIAESTLAVIIANGVEYRNADTGKVLARS